MKNKIINANRNSLYSNKILQITNHHYSGVFSLMNSVSGSVFGAIRSSTIMLADFFITDLPDSQLRISLIFGLFFLWTVNVTLLGVTVWSHWLELNPRMVCARRFPAHYLSIRPAQPMRSRLVARRRFQPMRVLWWVSVVELGQWAGSYLNTFQPMGKRDGVYLTNQKAVKIWTEKGENRALFYVVFFRARDIFLEILPFRVSIKSSPENQMLSSLKTNRMQVICTWYCLPKNSCPFLSSDFL